MKLIKTMIKLLTNTAKIPTKGSAGAAGRDLYADLGLHEDFMPIPAGKTVLIHTGIAMAIPEGMVGLVFARSGLATKRGLNLANGVAVIDSDYRGEWMIPIHNSSQEDQTIKNGERIAQVVFLKYKNVVFYPVKDLDDTERGEGGFGSTGTN